MSNFDQSSTGVNLELLCFYDADRATRDFEEAFHVLQSSGYRQNSILVFNGFGDQDVSDFSFTDLGNYDIEKVSVKEIFKAYITDHWGKCTSLIGFEEIKSTYENLGIDNTSLKNLDQFELLEFIETAFYCDQSYREFLESNFDKNYLIFRSVGYCQGDYSEIVVPKKVVDSVEDFEKAFSDSTFDNLLWNQPLYCRLGIEIEGNEEEFYFDEYIKDQYSYDESEILEIFENHYEGVHKEYIKGWLEDNLPTYPDCR